MTPHAPHATRSAPFPVSLVSLSGSTWQGGVQGSATLAPVGPVGVLEAIEHLDFEAVAGCEAITASQVTACGVSPVTHRLAWDRCSCVGLLLCPRHAETVLGEIRGHFRFRDAECRRCGTRGRFAELKVVPL